MLDPHVTAKGQGGNRGVHGPIALHLEELAGCLFKAYSDRLDYLNKYSFLLLLPGLVYLHIRFSHADEGTVTERERNRIEEEYRILRPIVLDHLGMASTSPYNTPTHCLDSSSRSHRIRIHPCRDIQRLPRSQRPILPLIRREAHVSQRSHSRVYQPIPWGFCISIVSVVYRAR